MGSFLYFSLSSRVSLLCPLHFGQIRHMFPQVSSRRPMDVFVFYDYLRSMNSHPYLDSQAGGSFVLWRSSRWMINVGALVGRHLRGRPSNSSKTPVLITTNVQEKNPWKRNQVGCFISVSQDEFGSCSKLCNPPTSAPPWSVLEQAGFLFAEGKTHHIHNE